MTNLSGQPSTLPVETTATIYGVFTITSKKRLDMTYDYETGAIASFREISEYLGCTTCIDVGANIGVYSVYVGSLDSIRNVYAFEPAPVAFDILRRNVAIQPYSPKTRCFRTAASDVEGKARFKMVGDLAGNNAISDAEDAMAKFIEVECSPVDQLVHVADETVCIKIDVEGHELKALHGMREILSSNRCYIQVEGLGVQKQNEVEAFLASLGYHWAFSLRDDHLFVSAGLADRLPGIMRILARHVSNDLLSLLRLRIDKRSLAQEAKQLWANAGYKRDPLFPTA